jgi:1-acyl-sn-glycerol-3-phosphate acyltransferase
MRAIPFENNSYTTAARSVSFISKVLPSWVFYFKLFRDVLRLSRIAKKAKFNKQVMHDSSLWVFNNLESVGVKIEITGAENLREPDVSCVFVSNHMSTLETFVLPAIILPFKDLAFVVKEELIRYPVFKYPMLASNPITVGRKNPREDLRAVMDGGLQRLNAGISVVIFPQTTRYVDFDPTRFNTIGIKLAKKAGVPVIPLAVKTDAWGMGKYIKDFGKIDPSKKVYFSFGKPLSIKGAGAEEHQEVIEFIRNKLLLWKR